MKRFDKSRDNGKAGYTPRAVSARTGSHRLLTALAGGFFVLAAAMIAVAYAKGWRDVEAGIPNDALGAIVVSRDQVIREWLNQFLPDVSKFDVDTLAVVALANPLETGLVARVPSGEPLTGLRTSRIALPIHPLGNGLVIIGTDSFAERVHASPKIPWWIRVKIVFQLKNHEGALLWSAEPTKPWLIGSLDSEGEVIRLEIPRPRASFGSSDSGVEVRRELEEILGALLPTNTPLTLPDGSIIQEVRSDPRAIRSVLEYEPRPLPLGSCSGLGDGFSLIRVSDQSAIFTVTFFEKSLIACFR